MLAGFSSGLPFFVLVTLVPAWLRTADTSLEAIGAASLVSLPYAWKVLWAPALDRFAVPGLDRRRGQALVTQVGLLGAVAALGRIAPGEDLAGVLVLGTLVAFLSATQDAVLDAWRREMLPDHLLGLGSALFVNAFRVAGLVPGSLAFLLADHLPWPTVYTVVAAFLGIGLIGTALAPAVEADLRPPTSLREAVVGPLRAFVEAHGARRGLGLLAFVVAYKLGDSVATALITPFYLDVGFTLTQIGTVAKFVGLGATVVGGLLGGLWMTRLGLHRSLWVFGAVQLASIPGFALLAWVGPVPAALAAAVAFEYLGVGLGTTAYVAFLQSLTDRRFTATQYALFTSLMALPRTLAQGLSGVLAEALGWPGFFLACTALAIPGMAMLPWIAPWSGATEPDAADG